MQTFLSVLHLTVDTVHGGTDEGRGRLLLQAYHERLQQRAVRRQLLGQPAAPHPPRHIRVQQQALPHHQAGDQYIYFFPTSKICTVFVATAATKRL